MIKFLLLLSMFSMTAHAQNLQSFLELKTDEEKVEFLNNKTELVENQSILSRYSKKNQSLMQKLNKAGLDEIDVWSDTILEGPYTLTGDPQIQLSGLYTKNRTVFALYGKVRHQALFIEGDACIYNEEKGTYTECPEVTIYDYFIIDTNGNYIDSKDYPETDH